MFHKPKFFRKKKISKTPQDQKTEPPDSLEANSHLAHEAYTKAFADVKSLFDASLQIDEKIDNGIKKVNQRWAWYIGACASVVGIISYFGVPQVLKSIRDRVTEQFVGKEAERQINQFTDTKVSAMIVSSVSNTEERVKAAFTRRMDEKVQLFEQRSEALDKRIKEAEEIINVYERSASARTGNRKDYDFLVELSGGTNRISHVASSIVEEIKKSFERKTSTYNISRTILINKNNRGKKVPEDVLIAIVYNNLIAQYEGAINTLADKGEKRYVAILIHVVRNSQYLDYVYAAIRGIEKMTEQSFPALGIQEVLEWWKKNEADSRYHCTLENYWEASILPDESEDDYAWRKARYLYEWIREMPNQFFSAAKLPLMLLFAQEDSENITERRELLEFAFEYWGQENPKAVGWYIFKTAYFAKFAPEHLVDFVNDRLKEHPEFEEELKQGVVGFTPEFFEIPDIHWPSKEIDTPQVEKDVEQE